MKNRKSLRHSIFSVLLTALVLAACGGDKPENMLASAKDYLSKNDSKSAVIQLKNALQANPDLAEARFLLGKALLEEGNAAAAEVELGKAAELKHPADEVIPLQARTQLKLGQMKKIVDELAKAQLDSPEGKADLQTSVGQAYLAMGKPDAAQAAFEAALNAVPDFAPAFIGQARLKASKRDFTGALAVLDSVLEKSPKAFEALQFKGDIFTVQGNPKGASEAYLKVLEIRPDYLPAHASLVSRYMEGGNLDEAGKQLESMRKVAPSHPQAIYLQAELLYRQKKFKEARDLLQQHLGRVPDSVPGLQLAGAIEYELQSYATAERYLLAALQKNPGLGMARRVLIITYLRSGQPDKALGVLQPILESIEKNSDMLALAGEVFMQNGDADKAGSYFAKASALDPENRNKQTSVALSHLVKGETETAYRELEKIASVDTGIKADMALIASQLKGGRFDQALKSIAALEKKQPENPLVPYLRGQALLGKKDIQAARGSFEQALAKNPAYFPAAASLASLDMADEKPEEARKRFENVVAKDPKNAQAWLALAELKARSGGKVDDVAALINKAIAANPVDASSRLALISLYLGAKDAKKAVSAAQDALGSLPDNPAILEAEGRALTAAENYNQALSSYGKLAALQPKSLLPHLRMAEVHLAAKDKDAAMQSLRKALAIKPDSIEVQRGIMMLDLDAGRSDAALATARKIQKQHPRNPAGYLLEGDVFVLKKSWREAASAYRNGIKQTGATELAIKLHNVMLADNLAGESDKFADGWLKEHPKDFRFRLYLAESASARKDYASAVKHYRLLLDNQPNNPLLLNNQAWVMSQAGDPKAIEFAEKAYRIAPDQPSIMDTLGTLLVAKGETDRGLELMRKANALAPKEPMIRLNLVKALIKAGKKDEAKSELTELSALGEKFPAHAEVMDLLQGLK